MLLMLQDSSCKESLQKAMTLIDQQTMFQQILLILLVTSVVVCTLLGWGLRKQFRDCPFCDATISAKAKVCRRCRKDLPAPNASPVAG